MISIMMFFVCGSFSLAIISLLPNIFPIFLTFGVMGIFNIPFDVSTIMIGSVTLGIVVDDTTHYMIWFRRNMVKNLSHRDAIVQTFRDVGKPTFLVSLVLCLGFGVLILGSIKPTQYFGLLSAFALFIAPFGDYFMLPALLLIFKPKVKR
jgi:predicted RND superfamily exporter protein